MCKQKAESADCFVSLLNDLKKMIDEKRLSRETHIDYCTMSFSLAQE